MKSLLDIQQDVRKLENSVQEIVESIKNVSADIDNIRNSSEGAALDFSKIEVLAKQIDFGKHPLDKLKDGHICQVYLEMLLSIVQLDSDEEVTINRMVFIQWLQIQARIDWTLEDLYKDSFKIDKKSYFEFVDLIPKKYKEYFFVDALIVANIAGNANEEIYEYIADIVTILGISERSIKELALVARLALSQRIDGIGREALEVLQDKAKGYSHYFKSEFTEDSQKALRVIVVELHDNVAKNFKWKVQQQQKVQRGDVIATYQKEKKSRGYSYIKNYELEEIRASVPGTIFQFRNNNTYYGVIAHEEDNKDSIKAWVKARI
jgi:hypothetical protein